MQHNDPRRFPGAWNFAGLCGSRMNLPQLTHHAAAALPGHFHGGCHDCEHQVALVLQDFDGGAQAQGWRGWRLWQAAWSTLSPSSRTSSCRGCGACCRLRAHRVPHGASASRALEALRCWSGASTSSRQRRWRLCMDSTWPSINNELCRRQDVRASKDGGEDATHQQLQARVPVRLTPQVSGAHRACRHGARLQQLVDVV